MSNLGKMELKEEQDQEQPSSPYRVFLDHFSEAIQNVYNGSPKRHLRGSGHRRSQSEGVEQSGGFRRWKFHMQKAWRRGDKSREQTCFSSFDPEILANQKRQWYQLHSKTQDHVRYKEPTSLFEHFIIAGLPSDVNLDVVENAFAKRKKWELETAESDVADLNLPQNGRPSIPTLEPQILFKYPPGKKIAMRLQDLATFCFPGAVKAQLLERTPSFSNLNKLVYGQEHLSSDDLSFIFSLKVADNATLYGVCVYVQEIVQRPPGILGGSSPLAQSPKGCSRFLVSAHRCYCLLTRVPFFELHYEMLNSIITQDRLNRVTEFVNEMTLSDCFPSLPKLHDQMSDSTDSPDRESFSDWMSSAIPVDSTLTITAAAAGIMLDDEFQSPSSRRWELHSPESVAAGEASDFNQVSRKKVQYFDDNVSEASEIHSECYEKWPPSPEFQLNFHSRNCSFEHISTSEPVFSPRRSIGSEDEDDDIFSNVEKDYRDDMIMEWARENKNDLLQIVCGYHALPLPPRGSNIVFQPLEHLQEIEYWRPPLSALGLNEKYIDVVLQDSWEAAKVKAKAAAAEEALALSIWTTATICRVLSIESVLTLMAGVLLEKQVVVVCPNLGVLAASILSLIPMIRPFEWQCLYLPVLPWKMLDFLDAPVPFIVGLQHKPADFRMRSNLVLINVLKDKVKISHLPELPGHKELVSELRPIHARLQCESTIAGKHPVYKCNEVQAEAATQFLSIMRRYLESLCKDLTSHTITSVQSTNERVSLLFKDSFVDAFPTRDQPFVKLFVETQLFNVLSDARLSVYENGNL